MMGMIWVVFLVALTGTNFGGCLPVRPSPQTYPHDVAGSNSEGWSPEGGVYTAVPALALILTAVSLLIGCTWCYRHKDCKLFTATATHIHDGRRAHPPDSGFSEPVNNNISEDNNNGPISLREMQNIANNNATAYIVTENEDRNRVSRESVVEFEPLPSGIRVVDPLERCTDWFGDNDFPRSGLQYLREIGRGWFGRVVEGEIENVGTTSTVAVKILNQNASLEDKARFLDEAKVYRDVRHENVLTFLAKCLQEDPWILIFELCSMDLQQYLITNRPIMTILNEAGVPLRLMCDYSSALAHLHSRGYIYGNLWSGSVLVRGDSENARGVLGRYAAPAPPYDFSPPETRSDPSTYTASSDTWCLGALLYELSASGAPPSAAPPPAPAPFRDHLYQVMQLCWNPQPEYRPSSAQVHALVRHLHSGGGPASCDFELRWQRLKPNTVAVLDEHVAIVHAPSVTSPLARSHGECPPAPDSLSVDMDTAVSRSSSIMSDKDPLSVQIKSESLTNLHGSLEDVRNIYLTHNETATLECHQGNIALDEAREKEQDRSDSSVDPWLKEIIAGSQDDVSYYKDVSDVIKNLDNILNSEKTSSSESSHQASPSRDNLSLDCKKNYPVQSSLVKSPGITDFQNILDTGFSSNLESQEICEDDDRDTIGTLSHSFERHSDDTTSQHTLENLTPDTPVKDIEVPSCGEVHLEIPDSNEVATIKPITVLPNEHNLVISDSKIPKLKKLCAISISNASDIEQLKVTKDCQTSCDSNLKEIIINKEETKSVDVVGKLQDVTSEIVSKISSNVDIENGIKEIVLPEVTEDVASKVEMILDKSLHSELPILQLELNRMDKTIVPSVSPVEEISDLIKATENLEANKPKEHSIEPSSKDFKSKSPEHTPEPVQRITNEISANILIESKETEITSPLLKESETTLTILPPEEVQNIITDDNCVLKQELQNIILADEQNTEIVESIDNKVVSDKVLSIEQSLVTEDNFGPIKSNGSFEPVEIVIKNQPVVNAKSLQDDYIESNLKFLVEEQKHASQNHVSSNHNNIHFVLSNGLPEALCNDLHEVSETATYALAKCPTEIQKDWHNTSNEAVHTSCNNLNTVITDDIHNSVENVVCQDANNHLNVASCSDLLQNVKESNGDKKIVESQNLYNAGDEIEATAKLEHILQRISEVDIPKSPVTPNEVQVQISDNEESKISKDHIQDIIDDFHSNINVYASENTVDQSNGIASVTDSFNLINSQKEHSTSLLKTVDEMLAQTEAETQKEYNATSTGIDLKSNSDNELPPQIANEVSTYSEAQKIIDQATIITECQAFVPKRLDSNQANVSKSEALTEEKAEFQDFQEDSILSQETDDAIEEAIRLVDEHFTSIITESPTQISDEITQESNFPNKSNSINEFETVTSKNIGNIISSNSIDLDPTIVCIDKNIELSRSENLVKSQSDESTAYMDLTNNKIPAGKLNSIENLDFDGLNIDKSPEKDDSTKYLDLPSIRETDNFIHMEKIFNSNNIDVVSSTPLASDSSTDTNNTIENPVKENDAYLSETNIPDYEGLTLTKLEQRYVPDNLSPFESPTKSHHTDTYDENSSVVLGPFENCTLELFRAVKSTELIDLPKEELLAFSSNFSEINLETPSPLRDVNFLNEVPDLVNDDIRFDDIKSISEKVSEPQTDTESQNSGTEKRVSPSTPPNSPGVFLASTSQVKYLVDIDLAEPLPEISTRDIEQLSHIEQQMTSKLAMAENENNLNLEYSGPLVIEGLDSLEDEGRDDLEESYLAGNGGYVEDLREQLRLDEESVRALRNELELKLPLAQVAAIEPPSESEWSSELPPPPELIVNYPRALSPITEETGPQLSAYENDINWNASIRTDSSESYPEPCNNSTDEVTELPTGAHHSTYTLPTHSPNNTYTLQRDAPTSREMTMSADSLNASPYKKIVTDGSPIDEKTYTKEEERESLERISQVSPFLLSPTTDTSAPEHSDNIDNAAGVSTLSKTTLPTDAKHSKPSETQCLSKATSIDSWCSNDTLYNVEENFDDLAMDPDLPQFEPEKEKEEENSESTDTLTHNEDDKEHSHCSTYIIHDSKSEACETFSPDSITANDNYTYTKAKTDNAGTTPSNVTTELNDSKTKDLAYGTLLSGVPSYSNCTTEVVSGFEDWKVAQPELVRKTPKSDDVDTTITKLMDDKISDISSPQLASEHSLKKIDSVEISCLQDNTLDTQNKTGIDTQGVLIHDDSPKYNYKNMAPSVTSTPITDHVEDANVDPIPMVLPEVKVESSEESVNFQNFFQSAEVRPQDLSSNTSQYANTDTEILLMGDSKTLSKNSNRDSIAVSDRTSTYSDFENSAITKPQDSYSKDKSSQSIESAISSEDFQKFEDSVKSRPQDLSSLIDASSLLLKSERISAELGMSSLQNSQSASRTDQSEISPPNDTNLNESHSLVNLREPAFLINFSAEDDTEQPHSIIVTETTIDSLKDNSNRTFDSYPNATANYGYNTSSNPQGKLQQLDTENGEILPENNVIINETSHSKPIMDDTFLIDNTSGLEDYKVQSNGSEKFATVQFLNETFEELIESNVDEGDKDLKSDETSQDCGDNPLESLISLNTVELDSPKQSITNELTDVLAVTNGVNDKVTVVTEDFLQNEKKFCQLDSYLPLMSDIRFTGPASEIMSTSFTEHSPTEPNEPKSPDLLATHNIAADILKEWDSDSDSHTSNSSSGEFIWKQRSQESQNSAPSQSERAASGASGGSGASGSSGSGSEGDEVEFVPSSWDCRAAPAKSSLRSLEQTTPDNKKRVVFKRQKYHCVYEYPREVADVDAHSPAYLPDLSTYAEWDPSSAADAELGYGQLFGGSPLDLYPLRAGIAFGPDYGEDFFISSSARPFESLGIMSTTSQFFPGKHIKPSILERDLSDDLTEEFPPPPSPLPPNTLTQTRTPSLDFTTPDSGVEDITPGSTLDEDFKKKIPESELTWRPVDSASSSESVSPSSPGGEALGGLRHTRDKLKLDLPPSPHIPSPRHNRVFNFVLDKPKRKERTEGNTPVVMTDETPVVTSTLPLPKVEDIPVPEPTFSTFGKSPPKVEPEQKLILTDDEEKEVKVESPKEKSVVEAVKGEGTVLDSGDEDSGIESSSKATLERKANIS